MKILETYTVKVHTAPASMYIVMAIAFIVGMVLLWRTLKVAEKEGTTQSIVLSIATAVALSLTIGLAFATLFYTEERTRHKVVIDNQTSIAEVQETYDIIKQNGLILIIEERAGNTPPTDNAPPTEKHQVTVKEAVERIYDNQQIVIYQGNDVLYRGQAGNVHDDEIYGLKVKTPGIGIGLANNIIEIYAEVDSNVE